MTTQGQTAGPLNSAVLGIAAIGFLVTGAMVLYALMGQGHAAFNTNDDGMFWGLPIVVYDFFLLASTGLALTATFGLVMGLTDFNAIAKRCLWLALAVLVGGVAALALELGYPLRALYAIPLNFQTASPLFWKVLFVAAYVILLLTLIAKVNRPDWTMRSTHGLAIAVLVAALGISMIAGSVYGMLAMKPFWHGGEIPVAFLIESMLAGLAFAIFFTYLAHGFSQENMPPGVRKLFTGQMPFAFVIVISLHAMFVGARTISGLWSVADGLEVWQHIASSPLFHFEIWVGIALPLALMLMPGLRTRGSVQIAVSVLVMLALFIARYDFIIGGQMVAPFKGEWVSELIRYQPSIAEWMLLLMAVFLTNAVNAFGERAMNLDAEPRAEG